MKKILAIVLTAVLLFGAVSVHAEEQQNKYDRLIVATITPFSGNFFSEALGNNITDQDVRKLIHGYSLVRWDSALGAYEFNRRVITGASVSADGRTYTFALAQGLTYNDGTPITAADYAFSLLLLGSGTLQEAAGGREDLSRIQGGKEYRSGMTNVLSGFRLLGDYQFALTIDEAFTPYFYQLQALDIIPMPIAVLAPGCAVKDDGDGVHISGPFTVELLQKTMLDSENGYISHPSVTCGPYMLTSYDGKQAVLDLNPGYLGDESGKKPSIPRIILRAESPDDVIDMLASGEIDLAVRCARSAQIRNGMQMIEGGDYAMKAYSRAGLSFISFCAEKGPTADVNVRKAITMCMDRQTLNVTYLGAFGTPVKGYYGIGQWMFMMANGTLVPEEGKEEEWADLSLDSIPQYTLDPEAAAKLLDEAGWNLNEDGGPYDAQAGGVRCKTVDGKLVPLTLKLIYPEGNGAGVLLNDLFAPHLKKAGMSLETLELPMPQLLEKYYGRAERDCDMILLGTNFGDVFDPSVSFDEKGTDVLSGITDPHLLELAVHMRSTEPGNAPEYCRRWIAFQAYREEILPEIPLYSDAYMDFHISALQNYEPARTGCWAIAVTDAILSDYVEEEEPGEGEEFFD